MVAQGIDYLALVPGANFTWLTGLHYMMLKRPVILLVAAQADAESLFVLPALEAPPWEAAPPLPARLLPWNDGEGPDGAMAQAAARMGPGRTVAAETYRMRLLEFNLMRAHLADFRTVSAEDVLTPARIVKDAAEIAAHQRAAHVVESALGEILAQVQVGMTEREIAGRLSAALLLHGGEPTPIEPHVQSGPNSAMPHGSTSHRSVERGDLLLFDFVTTVDGYYADITRTFVVGRDPNPEQERIYSLVQTANAAGLALARPGIACGDLDASVREVIAGAGYGEYFIHRTGHGLGLEVHEEPQIAPGSTRLLEPGMVFTIEPGIYLPGWGGVRIEDNVVVTGSGSESFTTFPRALTTIGA